MRRGGIILLLALLFPLVAAAHVGSPNVFFEGKAGPHAVRVIVRPPEVVPGLAEINVRVEGDVQQVSALPVFWKVGKKGAPPPDIAKLVRGETNLYATTLWFMSSGAYSVDVEVTGAAGKGSVSVPVNAVALTRRELPTGMGVVLGALSVFLFVMAIWLIGAAQGVSQVEPGAEISPGIRRRSITAMCVATVLYSSAVYAGKQWWDAVDADYRNNRLFQSIAMKADVRKEGAQRILRMEAEPPANPRRDNSPLMPDHGKIMHLFMVREPELNAFAHIHPVQRKKNIFEVALPPLPPGTYRLYADVTQESGFAQTMVATATITDEGTEAERLAWQQAARDPVCATPQFLNRDKNLFLPYDGDDSWHVGGPETPKVAGAGDVTLPKGAKTCRLANGSTMIWEGGEGLMENQAATLRFTVVDAAGKTLPLETYMGMHGHAAVRRKDGAVFAHLHPMGTISMASQERFVKQERGEGATDGKWGHQEGTAEAVSFPYEFPQSGPYRIWVQVKSGMQVYTGVFEAEVAGKDKAM